MRDVTGREFVDLTAGWGVTCIGHCHPALVEAISSQAGRLMQTTNLFYTLPQLDLIEKLAALTPDEITRSFLVNSGTEATEGALRLAHRATGRPRFVSTEGSFHGRTLGALGVIGQAKHREPYAALLPDPAIVPYGDRDAAGAAIDEETAAFIVEPIQGEGGVRVPPPGYLQAVREICRERGALLILDEVQTGIGRTGKMLALEHEDVVPDVLTLGKGLGGGYPIAAFLTTEEVAKTVSIGDHGGTYIGSPLACAAANAVLEVVCQGEAPGESRGARREDPGAAAELRRRSPGSGLGGAGTRAADRSGASRRREGSGPSRARPGAGDPGERHRRRRDAALPGAEHSRGRAVARRRHTAGAGEELSRRRQDASRAASRPRRG